METNPVSWDVVLKARWLEALRSGRYTQGAKALKKGGSYCCLGVLLDTVDPKGWAADLENTTSLYHWKHENEYGHSFLDRVIGLQNQQTLIQLNDQVCLTFQEIANYIEKHFVVKSTIALLMLMKFIISTADTIIMM